MVGGQVTAPEGRQTIRQVEDNDGKLRAMAQWSKGKALSQACSERNSRLREGESVADDVGILGKWSDLIGVFVALRDLIGCV